MGHKSNPYKKARSQFRWKWKKKRTFFILNLNFSKISWFLWNFSSKFSLNASKSTYFSLKSSRVLLWRQPLRSQNFRIFFYTDIFLSAKTFFSFYNFLNLKFFNHCRENSQQFQSFSIFFCKNKNRHSPLAKEASQDASALQVIALQVISPEFCNMSCFLWHVGDVLIASRQQPVVNFIASLSPEGF